MSHMHNIFLLRLHYSVFTTKGWVSIHQCTVDPCTHFTLLHPLSPPVTTTLFSLSMCLFWIRLLFYFILFMYVGMYVCVYLFIFYILNYMNFQVKMMAIFH